MRITLVAVLVVGVALVIGATVLLSVLREMLADEIANGTRVRSSELARTLASGSIPLDPLVEDPEDEILQILGPNGVVLASSRNVASLAPVAWPAPEQSVQIAHPIGGAPLVAVATEVDTPRGTLTAVVARSLEPVTELTDLVRLLLTVGLPVLLVVIAATSWVLIGRALAPIEAIRREVDEISATEIHRRVPDPPGDDEIARLARTMNRMLDRLESGQRRQHRFVSDASHELRTPVAVIRQHAEVALAHPERVSPAELAKTVLDENLRIQRLLEDLLLLARTDEHRLALRRLPVDLDDLVFDEARRLRGTTTGLRIDTTEVSAGRVDGDEAGLHQVLRNLGENAARHALGRVSFALAERASHVELYVDDDGPGIPETERARVLERFVRLDAARARATGGNGLGLSIVAELTAAHGGTVEITDSPHGGTRVALRLPRSSDSS